MIYWAIGLFLYLVIAMVTAAITYEDARGDPLGSTLVGVFWLPIAVVFVLTFIVVEPYLWFFGKPDKEPQPPNEQEENNARP